MQDSLANSVNPTVLVFDSGLGGLTVLREISALRNDLDLIYVADDERFPYGRRDDAELTAIVSSLMEDLIDGYKPDLVVIACNTASTLALPVLRAKHSIPFVGTVPAIKPACEQSKTKRISVLATPGTVKRDYTYDLIREFAAGCKVELVACARLAGVAERYFSGRTIAPFEISEEIAPAFVDDGSGKTDTVVLACTHYPLLMDYLRALAPWPVEWIDPAPAIARRVASLLPPPGPTFPGPVRLHFTSFRMPEPEFAKALESFGIDPATQPV